uniref:Putative homeodomain-containing protein n=1 Tax=Amblyomma aureolatum TaxID=187763 RepID=A0A1E1X4V6_9ACAR
MVLKFTVEQIDLVRRLKDTGITMKEIGIIYFKLERLERTIRRGADQRRPSPPHFSGANGGGFAAPNGAVTPPTTTTTTPGSVQQQQQPTPRNEDDECSSSSESSSAESPAHQQQNGFQQDCAVVGSSDPCLRSSTAPPDTSQAHSNAVVPRGVQGLAFPRRHHFRFTDSQLHVLRRAFEANPYPEADERDAIASECNLSALNSGELVPTDVTSSMVNNWFCNRRKDASKLLKHSSPSSDMTRLPQDALKRLTKQRERFTFVKGHLEILERHYQRNPYPSQNDKERVVEECNSYSMESGSSRCGFMTITNVSNWFANRRKREFHRTVQTPDTYCQQSSNYGGTVNNVGGRTLWGSDLTLPPPPHHHQPHHHHPHHHPHHLNGGMQPTIKEEPLDCDNTVVTASSYDRGEVLPDGGMSWSAELESAVTHGPPAPYQPVATPMGLGQDGAMHHHGMDSPVPNMVPGGDGSVLQPATAAMHQSVKQEGGDVWPLDNRILSTAWR